MQEAGSQGQGQQQRKLSPVVAGLGAAAIASAVTLVIMMSNPSPVAVTDQAATSTNQCQMFQRKLLVSTTTGSGTVRLREGNYLSPPIVLSAQPQAVVFPLPRPEAVPVEEVITVEGNANDVVITSDLTGLRHEFNVVGVLAFNVTWKPMKGC
jgi:malic enzyme